MEQDGARADGLLVEGGGELVVTRSALGVHCAPGVGHPEKKQKQRKRWCTENGKTEGRSEVGMG